jgi:transcriptional regulatory protein LevR
MARKVLNNIEEVMAFKIDVLFNNNLYIRMLADSGCISYRVIKESFALKY